MATNYEFNTASYSVEDVSDRFCAALGLERAKPLAPSPISSASWWASVTRMNSNEFKDEGARLGAAEAYTSITFEPRKTLAWEQETVGLLRIIETAVDLLSASPDTSGFLEFYDEIIVLEKRKGSGIVVDPRLIDPDDLDDQQVFRSALHQFPVVPIEQF